MNRRLQALGRLPVGTMNKTEAAYDLALRAQKQEGKILWHKFDGVKLRLADKCFLTVDFFVMTADGQLQAHDVKGSMAIVSDDAKVKMKVAAEIYPFQFFYAVPRAKKNGGAWDLIEASHGR